jgi:pyruvyl transferase EpsO
MTHQQMMDTLKNKLKELTTAVPVNRPVVYLDYPLHDNVGDLLIHQGGDAFLDDYNYKVLGRFSIHDFTYRPNKTIADVEWKKSVRNLDNLVTRYNPTLILHGGGNFGDIWPEFQKFRELIVQRFPTTPIVIFPQSIHFSSHAGKERAAKIFGAHKNLHIFTRDQESWEFVTKECGLPGTQMPDMAHQLWGRLPQDLPGKRAGTLTQRRRDRESIGNIDPNARYFDWDDLHRSGERFIIRSMRKWQGIDNPLRHVVSNYALWKIYRDDLVNRAVKSFQPYETIDTDRLHGMILGSLMGKQVVFGDGNYGKLHRYAKAWLSESPQLKSGMVTTASSVAG